MNKTATFSDDKAYRYTLWRTWEPKRGYVMFIGLNPSTADEVYDDPTIRRCIGFAKSWGYGALCMTNLFAYRATKPKKLLEAVHPIGSKNNQVLTTYAIGASIVIAAWGIHGGLNDRDEEVKALIPCMHYLKLTNGGYPAHPLYLSKTLLPVLWKSWEKNEYKEK